ncbi:hypothetical protein PPERSA_06467 [Pseudocohnilembus persalinus]|uniref:Uncharacterized protein n=1 Tax=Pseudocohnilembus persalinus TaxID=266149 RepID=A0A0V0QRL3_PSEPJ|nr:hypothetical protein PPERSA_06467 [Pseudocohnilembus persalinus]|eukprot:KRX04833.1 hypothetical protein PPERSA_06467 [Pseudocohnilembus persalinus]
MEKSKQKIHRFHWLPYFIGWSVVLDEDIQKKKKCTNDHNLGAAGKLPGKNFMPGKITRFQKLIPEQVRKQLENNTPEKVAAFKKDILQQVEKVFHNSEEKLLQALNKQKKNIIQQFEILLEKVNIHQLYDIEPLKQAIQNYLSIFIKSLKYFLL